MDLNDVEHIQFWRSTASTMSPCDLTGTDVTGCDRSRRRRQSRGGDGTADSVSVDGTNANDQIHIDIVDDA
jgi:hypothetical protein